MLNLTLTITMLNRILANPHDVNLIRKYGIEKCLIKYLPLDIYSLGMYLYTVVQG